MVARKKTIFKLTHTDEDYARIEELREACNEESISSLLLSGLQVLEFIVEQFREGNAMVFVERTEGELQEDVMREFHEMMDGKRRK